MVSNILFEIVHILLYRRGLVMLSVTPVVLVILCPVHQHAVECSRTQHSVQRILDTILYGLYVSIQMFLLH